MMPWPVPWSEVPPGAPVLHEDRVWQAYYIPPPIAQARLCGSTWDAVCYIDAAPTDLVLMLVPTETEAVANLRIVFPSSELVSE